MLSEDKSSERSRIRTKTCSNIVFATILGRIRAHGGPGQRSPGPPHPPPWGTPTTLIERRQRTTEKLSYVLVASN